LVIRPWWAGPGNDHVDAGNPHQSRHVGVGQGGTGDIALYSLERFGQAVVFLDVPVDGLPLVVG
jgi:hypothetical protein